MEKIKVGIAGLGRSGWDIHAHLLNKIQDKYEILAVCDHDETRRKEAENRFGCKSYPDIDSLLTEKEIELAIIATPSHLHAKNTIQALKAGKNVVCEKPMATNLSDADLMIETAEQENKILSVFQNKRYAPDFLKVKEIIDSGKLGRIVLIKIAYHGFGRRWDWQTLKKFGGGTLNNTGPHAIDHALQLFGEDEEPEIICQMDKTLTLGDADDHLKIIFKGKKSPVVDLEVSSCCAYPQENWFIMGTCGGLKGNFEKLVWKYFDPEKLPPRKLDTEPTANRSYNKDEIQFQEELWEMTKSDADYQLNFYVDLYETLKNSKPIVITPQSARKIMWVIETCHQLSGL